VASAVIRQLDVYKRPASSGDISEYLNLVATPEQCCIMVVLALTEACRMWPFLGLTAE